MRTHETEERPRAAESGAAAAELGDQGLQQLVQGNMEAADTPLRSALQDRVPSDPPSPPGDAGSSGSEDDWETGLEDSLLRLNVALSRHTAPPPATPSSESGATASEPAVAPAASGPPQFKGRGSRHFSSEHESQGGAEGDSGERRQLDHVLEFYALPPHIRTSHITAFLQPLHLHPVDPVVRWVDDQHALVLFPTADCAQRIFQHKQGHFKIRPFQEASAAAHDKSDSELLAPKIRPKTTDVVARRMLSHALGRSDLVDVQGERRLAQARRDHRAERQQRQVQLQTAWGD